MICVQETLTGPWLQPAALIKSFKTPRIIFGLLLAGLALTGCTSEYDILDGPSDVPQLKSAQGNLNYASFTLRHTPYPQLPGWGGDDMRNFLPVFLKSCVKFKNKPADQNPGLVKEFGTISDWLELCSKAASLINPNRQAIRYFFETNFKAYRVFHDGNPLGVFTGYYEAELQGSWQPSSLYNQPIYTKPEGLISVNLGKFRPELAGTVLIGQNINDKLLPYFSRAEINEGALTGQQLELLWVNSSVDAFFLHIQGSGRITMDNGTAIRVGYAGRNGHRYVAVGRELIAKGIISQYEMSMQAIRTWMEANPVAALKLMNTNPSYIFFRILKEPNPIGAMGIELSPGYSLAVDNNFIPYGIPIWLDITDPRELYPDTKLRRLVVSQDTGSAIRGSVRGDLYWGSGPEAAAVAGVMNEQGMYYLLLPK